VLVGLMDKCLDLFFDAGKLKKVKRAGWVNAGVKNAESVADHSFRVAFMAMILADDLDCDKTKLMEMALVHDLAESVIGDIPTPTWAKKEIIEKKLLAERDAINSIFAKIGKKMFVDLWEEFEAQETIESKALREIERLEKFIQATEYELGGHPASKLSDFWEELDAQITIPRLKKIAVELQRLRKAK
jgi:putative hydrolases of HD superfamily